MNAVLSGTFLSWLGIVRLGLVQTALGSIVVLTTSTLNRVMVVELALPAMLPGALVALHYAVQMLRPRWGFGSDVGGRRTPWIIGGMAVLALGAVKAAGATAWMGTNTAGGVGLAVIAFVLIGIGVGASGTTLLALLARRVAPSRRAAAATIVWMMMIAGMVLTATIAGKLLDPFSPERLVAVTAGVAAVALLVTVLAVHGVEQAPDRAEALASVAPQPQSGAKPSFREAFAQVWAEPQARQFTIFVFISMLAYNLQDLVLEPFAGTIFGMTPGESTQLSGMQHGGVLIGMIIVAVAGSSRVAGRFGSLRFWTIAGCLASALALFGLAVSGFWGPDWPLRSSVFLLGMANGAFAVAAIGSMMALAGEGRKAREGTRMGLWGAAQAIAFGLGGFLGTAAVDLMRSIVEAPVVAYATVFGIEACLFLVATVLAARIGQAKPAASAAKPPAAADAFSGQPVVRGAQ